MTRKARTAFSEIVKDPLGFLWSMLGALYEGFKLFLNLSPGRSPASSR